MLAEQNSVALTPLTMCSAIVECDQYLPDWTLAEPATASGDELRSITLPINFDTPFANTPMVQVGICGFDIDNCDTARLGARAVNITAYGFQLRLSTWRGSRVYRAEISWIALGHHLSGSGAC